MKFNAHLTLLGLAVLALVGCGRSSETVLSNQISEKRMVETYQVLYQEYGKKLQAIAQFRDESFSGASVRLIAPSKVQFNSKGMNEIPSSSKRGNGIELFGDDYEHSLSASGTYYEFADKNVDRAGKVSFALTNAKGTTEVTDVEIPQPARVKSPAAGEKVSANSDLRLELDIPDRQGTDRLSVVLHGKGLYSQYLGRFDLKESNEVIIPRATLEKLGWWNRLSVEIQRDRDIPSKTLEKEVRVISHPVLFKQK